jgi:Fe-S-cluster containining protein
MSLRDHCIRCGQCCLSSSPSLQLQDGPLVREGRIKRTALFTIRVGETVRDNIEGVLRITDEEIIKVKEREDGGGCIYYDERANGCRIYDHRPVQCEALACWDASPFLRAYEGPNATRKDIIEDRLLLGLTARHEEECGYHKLERLVGEIPREGERAVEKILSMLRFDFTLRPFIARKMALDLAEMDFIFGRPLIQTIGRFGLKVTQEADGSFLLTPSHAHES